VPMAKVPRASARSRLFKPLLSRWSTDAGLYRAL
jgi:hypothetical protein